MAVLPTVFTPVFRVLGQRAGPRDASRPAPWVAPVLYAAVLAGGLYYAAVGEPRVPADRSFAFAGGIAALFALEVLEWRRFPARTPVRPAVALLLARLALFSGVAAVDGSGIARALFVLVPFTAYFAFGRRTSIALGAGCVGLLLAGFSLSVPGWYADAEYVSDLLMFALGLVLAIAMAAVAADEQEGRARLEGTLRELTAYTARVAELSAAAERVRLARDIHDSLGHHLTAIGIQLEKASAFRDREPAAAEQALADARGSARRALVEVRQSVRALRDEATPFRLSAALAELARNAGDDELEVRLDVTGEEHGHGEAALTALYRAAQEGLTNARRHGRATRVTLSAAFDDSAARLVVADNGRGFTAPAAAGRRQGYGLLGMRERVRLLGGHVGVDSAPGAGTTLTVTIPRVPKEPAI